MLHEFKDKAKILPIHELVGLLNQKFEVQDFGTRDLNSLIIVLKNNQTFFKKDVLNNFLDNFIKYTDALKYKKKDNVPFQQLALLSNLIISGVNEITDKETGVTYDALGSIARFATVDKNGMDFCVERMNVELSKNNPMSLAYYHDKLDSLPSVSQTKAKIFDRTSSIGSAIKASVANAVALCATQAQNLKQSIFKKLRNGIDFVKTARAEHEALFTNEPLLRDYFEDMSDVFPPVEVVPVKGVKPAFEPISPPEQVVPSIIEDLVEDSEPTQEEPLKRTRRRRQTPAYGQFYYGGQYRDQDKLSNRLTSLLDRTWKIWVPSLVAGLVGAIVLVSAHVNKAPEYDYYGDDNNASAAFNDASAVDTPNSMEKTIQKLQAKNAAEAKVSYERLKGQRDAGLNRFNDAAETAIYGKTIKQIESDYAAANKLTYTDAEYKEFGGDAIDKEPVKLASKSITKKTYTPKNVKVTFQEKATTPYHADPETGYNAKQWSNYDGAYKGFDATSLINIASKLDIMDNTTNTKDSYITKFTSCTPKTECQNELVQKILSRDSALRYEVAVTAPTLDLK